MRKFILIDTHALTPNLQESSTEVEAPTACDAVAAFTGRAVTDLVASPHGLPTVQHVSARTGDALSLIVVELSNVPPLSQVFAAQTRSQNVLQHRWGLTDEEVAAEVALAARLNAENVDPDDERCHLAEHPEGLKRGGHVAAFVEDGAVAFFNCLAEEWEPFNN